MKILRAFFLLLLGTPFLVSNLPGKESPPQFKTVEVKHFTQADGLALSPNFVNGFYDGLRERLQKEKIADLVVEEGATVPDADAAASVVLEGQFTNFHKGGFGAGIGSVSTEIKLYRRSDHTLIKAITPKVPFKPSPLNTDPSLGRSTGSKTAIEIKKALK